MARPVSRCLPDLRILQGAGRSAVATGGLLAAWVVVRLAMDPGGKPSGDIQIVTEN
jgi:hypothetical protein